MRFVNDAVSPEVLAIARRLDTLTGDRERLVVAGVSRHRHVTRLAAALGRALARLADRRTIVADAHFGDRRFAEAAGYGGRPGVADIIAGSARLEEVVDWPKGGLMGFVPNGRATPDLEAGLVSTSDVRMLMDALEAMADLALVAAPPLHDSVFAQIVAGEATGALLMVHAGVDTEPQVLETVAMLRELGVSLKGCVLVQRGRGP